MAIMRCSALTKGGDQCSREAMNDSVYCYSHDPAYAEERHRNASLGGQTGGRGRPSSISSELARLQHIFERLAESIENGEIDRGDAAVMIQAYNGARGCIAAALKAQEQEELALELEQISSMLAARGVEWRA
jgi:hypothetical protein